jgi:hypothetical protein
LTLREEILIHILRPCFLNPLRFKHCLLKLSHNRTIHLQYDHSSLITAKEESPKKNSAKKKQLQTQLFRFSSHPTPLQALVGHQKKPPSKMEPQTLSKIFNTSFFKNQKTIAPCVGVSYMEKDWNKRKQRENTWGSHSKLTHIPAKIISSSACH